MVMKEKFWERLTERHGRPELRDDARFRTFADRLASRTALAPILEAAFRERTTAEWVERLRGHVPVAPVYDVPEALADEQVAARDMIVTLEHPLFGALRTIGCPIRFPDAPPRYVPGAPLGADTESVLAEVGLSAADVAALRDRGVV
jgi:crotonobetainyl-CoA:carnitine CoA-transferase CaiB-like acyl-CoA transferase